MSTSVISLRGPFWIARHPFRKVVSVSVRVIKEVLYRLPFDIGILNGYYKLPMDTFSTDSLWTILYAPCGLRMHTLLRESYCAVLGASRVLIYVRYGTILIGSFLSNVKCVFDLMVGIWRRFVAKN